MSTELFGKSCKEKDSALLYNGIILPDEWPPKNIDPSSTDPIKPPYLESPPSIIPIDVGRQLFVDDFLIESSTLEQVFHMPVKYSGNPVMEAETELEINAPYCSAAVPKSGGVWWDPEEKIFKMWYEAGWLHSICYATSRDGLNWQRPALKINSGTNRILPLELGANSISVFPDWDAKDPSQKYTMRFQPTNREMNDSGLCMTSSDGIDWQNHTKTSPVGDRSTHYYNPFRKKWVQSIRAYFRGRSRLYSESDDFLSGASWTPDDAPVVWAAADRDDIPDPKIGDTPQLYNIDAVAYESLMLGIFEIHRGPVNDICARAGMPKTTDLNFAYSRNGFHWSRPDRRAHIPSERRDVWDRGYVQSVGGICLIRGDKLWFYYSGFKGNPDKATNVETVNSGMYDRGATGLAFLRRDGFASMDAGSTTSTLTTRPVTFSGKHLFVNANVALAGRLRAAILDDTGTQISHYSLENSIPFSGDSTIQQMGWNGGSDLSALKGKAVRFLFEVTNGSLYAFWVSRDESGRSDGYVAAGGPGFTGMTDTVGKASLDAERKMCPPYK